MKQFDVTGMSCAACSARVEKAVSAVPGVTSCSVNLLSNSMGVEGEASERDIVAAVEAAGYGANVRGENTKEKTADEFEDKVTPVLRRRLLTSLVFLVALMYVSMGHTMWGWPLPSFFHKNWIAIGLLELVLAAIVLIINQRFFVSGVKGLIKRAPNMDTLVALGSGASFIYSVFVLFRLTMFESDGHPNFYFESAAMIVTLITVGKMLEARSKGKTTDALRSLLALAPKQATILRDGLEVTVEIGEVVVGDLYVVRPGESIPVDGVILEGHSAVNEAALTGESIPVDKEAGDFVHAATMNQSGFLRCKATGVGEDTTLAQIIRMVTDAAATKAPIAKIADQVSGIFVPIVMVIALVTFVIWMVVGNGITFAIARAIAVLVISCPCALGLATPVAIMVGNGVGAKHGILFKNAVALEQAGRTEIVVLDKTGTITTGTPVMTDVVLAEGISDEDLRFYAASLEAKSEHPLAKAITYERVAEVTDFSAVPGNGLKGTLGEDVLIGGNYTFISRFVEVPQEILTQGEELAAQGKTPLFFAKNEQLLGIIAVADTLKEDSAQAIAELRNMGIRVVMLTGDNARTAMAIGEMAGVDEVIAGVLPDGKEREIRRLKTEGKVAMVGDGINDAPALMRADLGMAIGAGTDVAIDAADVVLMQSRLRDVSGAIRLGRATLRNIRQNLFWAFFYNIVGIPLAAGFWYPIFGWELNPMFGAAAMSLSSVCVVTNALRLNLCDVHDASRDKKRKKRKEGKKMTKKMVIEGMMCGHCEARVKKVLEDLPQVVVVEVSHQDGTAVVTLDGELSNADLQKTVEDQGYVVKSVE